MADEFTGTVEGAGGLRLFYRGRSAVDARGRLLAVHGLGDHSGRFEAVAAAAVERGLDFYALDLRGHGRSQGRRGHAAALDRLLQDVDRFRRRARAETSAKPTILLGHSLGGLVVGRYVQEFGFPGLYGAVLVAPFLEVALKPPAWKLRLGGIADRILPALTLGNEIAVDDQFRDVAERQRWLADPLVHDRISARLFNEMQRNARLFRSRVDQMRTPFLVLVPGDDRIVSASATVECTKRFGGPVDVRDYPGAFHALLQDPSTDRVIADISDWIEARLDHDGGASSPGLV